MQIAARPSVVVRNPTGGLNRATQSCKSLDRRSSRGRLPRAVGRRRCARPRRPAGSGESRRDRGMERDRRAHTRRERHTDPGVPAVLRLRLDRRARRGGGRRRRYAPYAKQPRAHRTPPRRPPRRRPRTRSSATTSRRPRRRSAPTTPPPSRRSPRASARPTASGRGGGRRHPRTAAYGRRPQRRRDAGRDPRAGGVASDAARVRADGGSLARFVRPLLLKSPTQIRLPGPDALNSTAYARDFAEVKAMGAASGGHAYRADRDRQVLERQPCPPVPDRVP